MKDSDAPQQLVDKAFETVADDMLLARLSSNILKMALPNSASIIADEVLKMAGEGVK